MSWDICQSPRSVPLKSLIFLHTDIFGYFVCFQHNVVKHYYVDWETWLHDLDVQKNGNQWWTQKALGWRFFLRLSIGGEGITRSDQNMDLCKSLVWACFSAKTWIANVSIFVSLSNAFLLQGSSRWKRSKIHVQRMLRLKKKSKFMKISEWKHVEDDLTLWKAGKPTSSQRWMSPIVTLDWKNTAWLTSTCHTC